ncbi:MAG: aminotransferase class I/II-fold pyridoxal phosphate-dependent enzyme [Acidimicrobiia bacterium]|nr:MAG: aminotransferase class I/II-fold pyridoxal phosphate-dependent enzyme [Acidimicrobiia bacterium]
MRVNPILERLGANPMAALHERARALAADGPVLDFTVGDPREATPPVVPAALRDAVPAVSQYPVAAGLPGARRAAADYVERRTGVAVDPDTQVLITGGSKEAVFHTPTALCEIGSDAVAICPTPGYTPYERGALHAGITPHLHPLSGDFVLRPDDLDSELWDRAEILWTNYPHNPSGAVMGERDLRALMERAREEDCWFAADECYLDVYEGAPPLSALQFADEGLTGVLSYLSNSKRDGMTGYRSGAVVGDARAIEAMRKLKQVAGTTPPEFVQEAAIAAWSTDDHVGERNEAFARKRAILRSAFEGLGYEVVASEAGLYLWVAVDDDQAIADRLLASRILVTPGRVFGPGGEGHIRLALVPTIDACTHASEEIRRCLTKP